MEMRILADKPLAGLNDIFPDGLLLEDGEEFEGDQESDYFILADGSVTEGNARQILAILNQDEIPAQIYFTAVTCGVVMIPKQWVCEK